MAAGVLQLGYLGFEVKDLATWEAFGTGVLGLEVGSRREGGGFSLRMDGREQRFLLEPGPADDLSLIGWQVENEIVLAELAAKLRAAGVDATEGTPQEAAARKVQRLVKYRDPAGIPSELFCGPAIAERPFVSKVVASGFVADELGLGHAVITADDQQASKDFYCNLLGFRLSDRIVANVHGYQADLVFLHANARHHSVAFGQKQRKRLHHFMLEVRAMDDVGLAFDRTLKAGLRIAQTLGRHPNDRMFSFYAKTPSGFQFELGWGGREVDDATWQPAVHDRISEWGHHPPGILAPPRKGAAPKT
jgi:2,3-dihydroxybiphenyl 1,2-dioxygenase